MAKNFNYMIDFLCQIKILQLKMLKLLKIPGVSRFFSKFLKFQVFPGKVATLYIVFEKIPPL